MASRDRTPLGEALLAVRGSLLSAGLFSLVINLLMLVPPLYMLQLYDRVLVSRSESTLLLLTLVVLFLFLILALLELIRARVLIRVGVRIEGLLDKRVFDAALERSRVRPGAGGGQPLRDLTTLRQYLSGNGPFALFDAPWLPIYLLILYLFHPWYGALASVAAVLLLTLALINEWRTRGPLKSANSASIGSFGHVGELQKQAEMVYALGMGAALRRRWHQLHQRFVTLQLEASDRSSLWSTLSRSVRLTSQSLLLGLGAWLVIRMELTPGMMIAGSIIMGRALAPLDLLIGSWRGLTEARSARGRLEELLGESCEEPERMALPPLAGSLQLKGVVSSPPGVELAVLNGIDLTIGAGESVGIVGPSAAGKSSLARVMLGLWPVESGEVRLDGAEPGQWTREALGPHLGYLPQEIELFPGSIADNIARFGEVDGERVIDAARLAGVHEMILQLPDGYDTLVGSGGWVLSGGQRQRVGLARAVYGEPKLVVLDEPDSHLDDAGERALMDALTELRQRRVTLVLISHRQSLLEGVDRLVVLQQGRVVMQGARQAVLAKLAAASSRRAVGR
jgi:ATP-binding cassette subfamily C protein EexD